jgi:hypothetical protein
MSDTAGKTLYQTRCPDCDWVGPKRLAQGQALRDYKGHRTDVHTAKGKQELDHYLSKQKAPVPYDKLRQNARWREPDKV